MVRISGYGQTGPYRERPGFGVIGEAMGGLRTSPARQTVRRRATGISIGDTLSALYGVIGALMALESRRKSGRGQVVDVACTSPCSPSWNRCCPSSTRSASCATHRIDPARHCAHVRLSLQRRQPRADRRNGDSIFRRLALAMGRADLAADRSSRTTTAAPRVRRGWTTRSKRGRHARTGRRARRDEKANVRRADLHRRRHRRRPAFRGAGK